MPILLLVLGTLMLGCGARSGGTPDAPIVSNVPFAAGERLVYSLHNDAAAVVARGTLSVRREGSMFLLEQAYAEAGAEAGQGPTDSSTVAVDASTLRPRSLERTVVTPEGKRHYGASYVPEAQTVDLVAGDEQARTLELPEYAYDNESSLWLWRTLDFHEGFTTRYVSVSAVDRARQTVTLTVTGRQRIEVPAGAFDAWRLQVRSGRATHVAWINVETPHEVVQWDNGSLVFKLQSAR